MGVPNNLFNGIVLSMCMHTPKFPGNDFTFRVDGNTVLAVPTEKRVRAFMKEGVLADSVNVLILRIPGKPVIYSFPSMDVRLSAMEKDGEGSDELGKYASYSMKENGRVIAGLAKLYRETPEGMQGLHDRVILDWTSVDRWMEEEENVMVHPRDPYTRIDVLESSRKVEIRMKGVKIAESSRPMMLFETGLPARYYVPPKDVEMEFLVPSRHETRCPYKGKASYWDIRIEGETFKNMAWSYLEPFGESRKIKGYFCFYTERLDEMTVDGKEIE